MVTVWWNDVFGIVSQQSPQRVVFSQVQILPALPCPEAVHTCPSYTFVCNKYFLQLTIPAKNPSSSRDVHAPILGIKVEIGKKKREERLSSEDMLLSNSSCLQNWLVDMNHNHNREHHAGLQRCSISYENKLSWDESICSKGFFPQGVQTYPTISQQMHATIDSSWTFVRLGQHCTFVTTSNKDFFIKKMQPWSQTKIFLTVCTRIVIAATTTCDLLSDPIYNDYHHSIHLDHLPQDPQKFLKVKSQTDWSMTLNIVDASALSSVSEKFGTAFPNVLSKEIKKEKCTKTKRGKQQKLLWW